MTRKQLVLVVFGSLMGFACGAPGEDLIVQEIQSASTQSTKGVAPATVNCATGTLVDVNSNNIAAATPYGLVVLEASGAVCMHSPGYFPIAILRKNGGGVWRASYQGQPRVQIDNNSATVGVATPDSSNIYIWHSNGRLFRYNGTPYSWTMIGDLNTVRIGADTVALTGGPSGTYIYAIGNDSYHTIRYYNWQNGQYAGTADDNSTSWKLAGGMYYRGLFQLHSNDREIWRWNGSFRNWTRIDQYPYSQQIVAGTQYIYQWHWSPNRVHIGDGSGWWYQIDSARGTSELAIYEYDVYQRTSTGAVYYNTPFPNPNTNWYWVADSAARIFTRVGNPNS